MLMSYKPDDYEGVVYVTTDFADAKQFVTDTNFSEPDLTTLRVHRFELGKMRIFYPMFWWMHGQVIGKNKFEEGENNATFV